MGRIGHSVLLYELNNWQIRSAVRGYYRDQRPTYEAARLLGLWTVSCQRSQNQPALALSDLVTFPWDADAAPKIPTSEDMEALERLLEEARIHNANIKDKK